MQNIEIIKQLLDGNHLNKKELEQAKKIIYSLNLALKQRGIKQSI